MQHQVRRRLLVLAPIALVAAANNGALAQKKKSIAIEIGSFDDKDEFSAWVAYALGLADWATKSGAADRSSDGILVPTFDGELDARRMQLQIWSEMLEKQPIRLKYMDELLLVQAAGFLREYIWKFHRQSSWKSEPTGLRLVDFEEWRSRELVNHEPRIGAQIRITS